MNHRILTKSRRNLYLTQLTKNAENVMKEEIKNFIEPQQREGVLG
jgi:hypothetical protein